MHWRAIAGGVLALSASAAGLVLWRAERAAHTAAIETSAASAIAFTATILKTSDPPGIEMIGTPMAFRDVAVFRDRLYASGAAGLNAYDADGKLLQRYRVGRELPQAELLSMSAGGSELFMATHGAGVIAFDGQRFRDIRPRDGIRANSTAVLALSTGRLLIGTEHGLLVYDGRAMTAFAAPLETAHVTALAGAEGDLWIGTLRDGVFHYHSGQLDAFKDALPDPQVLSIARSEGAVFVGTPVGVAEFRGGKPARTVAEGYFATALMFESGCLSVGTEDEGITRIPLQPHACGGVGQGIQGAVHRIALLGGVRFAVTDRAVYHLDGAEGWKRAIEAEPTALTARNISALAIGKSGRLWVGYFDEGLDIIDAGLDHVTHVEDDHLFCVNRIVPSPAADRMAVATANGLVMFDSGGQVRQVLGRKDGLLADHVTDVAFRPGEMMVATPAGLSFVDGAGVRSLYAFHGLVNNHVYTLATAGSRTLAGTLGGISSVENDTVRVNYDASNSGLRHNWITAIVASGGDWFAGTYGAGVFRMQSRPGSGADNGRWQALNSAKDGFIVNPNAMLVVGDRVYAGTLGRGLLVFDRVSGRWISANEGLPSANVTALVEARGYVYAGTDNGLVRFSADAF